MRKYVASMVIYPPEPRFPEERKNIVYFQIEENRVPDECFKLKYWHHSWVSDSPIELGAPCLCGAEKAIKNE